MYRRYTLIISILLRGPSEIPSIENMAISEAQALIKELDLSPHPEGGHYRRIYTAPAEPGERPALSVIHYLLQEGEKSRWHVVGLDEIWIFQHGSALELLTFHPEHNAPEMVRLGSRRSHHLVPAGLWQAARVREGFALCACAVAPAFDFGDFRLVSDLAGHEVPFENVLKDYRDLL